MYIYEHAMKVTEFSKELIFQLSINKTNDNLQQL